MTWPAFVLWTLILLWLAHALVLFAHEYAHSFTAWLLGWKMNPLALDYARPTLPVFLAQLGINQNVDERPIFASGHGYQAALISAAGMLVGNALLTLSLGRWLYSFASKRKARLLAMLAYWITVASIGNLIDYVPTRVFFPGGDYTQDMWATEQGLGWSPWVLLVMLGIPTIFAVAYLFLRIEPETLSNLFPRSRAKRAFLGVLTALFLFAFYGAAGLSDGPAAHVMSLVSVYLLAPVMALVTGLRLGRNR